MKKNEAIKRLEELRELAEEFENIEVKDYDVQALDFAIATLKETAPEIPVQEQDHLHSLSLKEGENFQLKLDNFNLIGITSYEFKRTINNIADLTLNMKVKISKIEI